MRRRSKVLKPTKRVIKNSLFNSFSVSRSVSRFMTSPRRLMYNTQLARQTRQLAKRFEVRPSPIKRRFEPKIHIFINNNFDTIKPAVCLARKVRRAVLFAKGKAGGNHKPPKKSLFSDIRC